jgi:hypothetical protein
MKKWRFFWGAVLIFFGVFWGTGCAYRYYMGFHGPSIKAYPKIHEGVIRDEDCLSCHRPDRDPEGPPTTHPEFHGCLNCHNDDL